MRALLVAVAFATGGCTLAAGALSASRADLGQARFVGPPKTDRCASPAVRDRAACLRARDEALAFVRRLSVDDQICLDGNPLRDGVTARCRVRAFVEDVSATQVKLEIRDAPPGSSFELMGDYWYHEAALVDLALTSAGFR